MELNAEQIKKALDWLDSLVGNSNDSDIAMFTYQLLGILYDTCEELTEDYKALDMELRTANTELHATRTELTRVQAENERLRNRITCSVTITDEQVEEIKADCLERIELDIKAIQADTVRKMQERLKSHFDTYSDENEATALYMRNLIDQIAKEMENE